MIKTLAKSIREYKLSTILSPIIVTGEVVLECLIPFVINELGNAISAGVGLWENGATSWSTLGIGQYALILVCKGFLRFCEKFAQRPLL